MTPGQSASQPASQPACANQTRFSDPHHMHGVWDLLERGGATWFAMLLRYNKEKCITSNKCGLNVGPSVVFVPSSVL